MKLKLWTAAAIALLTAALLAENMDSALKRLAEVQKSALAQKQIADKSAAAGAALLANRKYAEAVPRYLDAALASPADAELYYNLASALSGAGKFEEAKKTLALGFELLDDAGKARWRERFSADSQPEKPFYGLVSAYTKQILQGNGWGAMPDDVAGITAGARDTFYTVSRAKAAQPAIDQKKEAMMQATCRKASKDLGSTSILQSLSRSALKAAGKTSGRVVIGNASCTIEAGAESCSGMLRGVSMGECTGGGPSGSYSECECNVFMRVPGGQASVKVE